MSRAESSGLSALLHDYREFAGPRLWSLLALMLVASAAEGFGILMLIPLVTIAVVGKVDGGVAVGPLAEALRDWTSNERFALALGLFVGAMAVRSILVVLRDTQAVRLSAAYESSLRLRAANTLASRGWTFASGIGQAGMQSLLLTDVPRSVVAIAQAQQFAIAGTMLAVQMTLAALLSIELTAFALAVLVAGSIAALGWTRRGVRSGEAITRRAEESAGTGFRFHAALKSSLAQGTVPHFIAEYRHSLDQAERDVVRFLSDVANSRALAFFGSAVTAALLFFVGYRLLALPFPILITCLILFARIAAPAQQLQQSAQQVAANAPSFAAIERRLGKLQSNAGAGTAAAQPIDWTELRLDGATFEHRPGHGIADASFSVERGRWIGLSGPSGAGKTTLIDLVSGLLQPQQGAVLIDGVRIGDAGFDRWRAGLAYVGQDDSVFDDTVRGNLMVAASSATDEQLWEAIELVGLGARLRGWANGLDERVGDRGNSLSGGERQRLAMARALLRKPSLWILDEATAALDVGSEAAVLRAIRTFDPKASAIVVAHRPSTLAHCDSVVRIQHGSVETRGD